MMDEHVHESRARHLLGNAEAVVVMTEALLDRHGQRLDATTQAQLRAAMDGLRADIAQGDAEKIRARLVAFDGFSACFAELVQSSRRA